MLFGIVANIEYLGQEYEKNWGQKLQLNEI